MSSKQLLPDSWQDAQYRHFLALQPRLLSVVAANEVSYLLSPPTNGMSSQDHFPEIIAEKGGNEREINE